MAVKLPSGINARMNETGGRSRRQYRASVSDKSQRTETGRARQVCSRWFDTLAEAKEWREEQLVQLRTKGSIARDNRTTMGEACSAFVSLAEKAGVDGRRPIENATSERYRSSLRTVIDPSMGLMRVSEMTTPLLVRWRDDALLEHGRDAAIRALALVKQVLRYQATIGAIPVDPSAAVRLARADATMEDEDGVVEVFLSPDEVRRLLAAADRLADTGGTASGRGMGEHQRRQRREAWIWARPLVYGLVLGGPRMGEASALRWSDVDWDAGTLRIQRARKRDGSIGAPKNRSSIRTITMGREFMAILRGLWTSRNDWRDDDYIFGGTPSQPLNAGNFGRRQWHDLLAEADLLDEDGGHAWTPHDCRHYHASVLIMAGTNVQLVADRLGHANTVVTQTVYAHLFKELAGKANTAGADLEGVLLGR